MTTASAEWWRCPNPACNASNHPTITVCGLCHHPKPGVQPAAPEPTDVLGVEQIEKWRALAKALRSSPMQDLRDAILTVIASHESLRTALASARAVIKGAAEHQRHTESRPAPLRVVHHASREETMSEAELRRIESMVTLVTQSDLTSDDEPNWATDTRNLIAEIRSQRTALASARAALGAIATACDMIETADARNLANDGPAGGCPPQMSLREWQVLYKTLKAALPPNV